MGINIGMHVLVKGICKSTKMHPLSSTMPPIVEYTILSFCTTEHVQEVSMKGSTFVACNQSNISASFDSLPNYAK